MRILLALTLAAAACGGASDIPDLRELPRSTNEGIDWRDQIIYQIMVDRFENGDPNNDYNVRLSIPGRSTAPGAHPRPESAPPDRGAAPP